MRNVLAQKRPCKPGLVYSRLTCSLQNLDLMQMRGAGFRAALDGKSKISQGAGAPKNHVSHSSLDLSTFLPMEDTLEPTIEPVVGSPPPPPQGSNTHQPAASPHQPAASRHQTLNPEQHAIAAGQSSHSPTRLREEAESWSPRHFFGEPLFPSDGSHATYNGSSPKRYDQQIHQYGSPVGSQWTAAEHRSSVRPSAEGHMQRQGHFDVAQQNNDPAKVLTPRGAEVRSLRRSL